MAAPQARAARVAALSRSRAFARLALFAVALLTVVLLVRQLGVLDQARASEYVSQLRDIRTHPAAAPVFVVAYVLATILALPGSVLTLIGGAVFGFGAGLLLNWTGALLGAMGAFVVAQRAGRRSMRALLGSRAERLDQLSHAHGFGALLRLRLIPVIPFNALNYGAALAGVRFRDFVLATAAGILPGTAIYTWFADALVAGAAEARREAFMQALVAGLLLILLSFLPALARRAGLFRGRSARLDGDPAQRP